MREKGSQPARKIIHVDMDCFFAAIEVRNDPSLRGKPVAVCGSSPRSVLTTASYEARAYGCHSAMPLFQARERCPDLIVVPPRGEVYREESQKIRAIFRSYTELIEPLSLDEAFLDVSHQRRYGTELAREIRARIWEETQLTASAGIAPNKMLAKIASDWRKPNGQYTIPPNRVEAFLQELPVRKLWGVGPKANTRLAERGIETCGQLQGLSEADLVREFGSWGMELYRLSRGFDDRPVQARRIRKSLSTEHTFRENKESLEACEEALRPLFEELLADLEQKMPARPIRNLFVKVKFADFQQTTAERACPVPDFATARELLAEGFGRSGQSVRLLGIGVRFEEAAEGQPRQLELHLGS